MAEGEDIGDELTSTQNGHCITPFNSKQQVNPQRGRSSFTMSLIEATPEDAVPETIMEAALTSGLPPKKNQLLTILPIVELQQDDVLVKGKAAEGDVFSGLILEEYISRVAELNHIVDLICRLLTYLETLDGNYRKLPHQPKDIEYAQKIENVTMKQEDSSLDEILSKEMDLLFLRQLLEDILDSQESSLDAEKGGIPPDPALACLGCGTIMSSSWKR